jgi:acetyl/propionyl-CoA carboxylase alpha subunit
LKKILIANRGEIALRVMRSAREMGIKTVAVYSEADRNSPHVRYADEAVCIGPPASSQSYLRGDKIIEVCKMLGVDGIHPGYGFLSENANFARMVKDAGITFIGPSAEAMDMMGSKLAAKAAAKAHNIPLVPGTDEAISDPEAARKIAAEIGFPVLIKASAGGGGKGMRVVNRSEDFLEQLQLAVSEAISAFGDGSVFIERYVGSPRHIEIQVMADNHGNCVYLFERECSIQRRHQKVVEEAPSSVLTPQLRKEMGECAVRIAKACNYSGAGTVEFLLDEKLNFYFLEMNTRLQVEHPVTEMITGKDLVREQIRVARNEKLSFAQEDLTINGHAM